MHFRNKAAALLSILAFATLATLTAAGCRKNKDDGGGDNGETTAQKASTVISVQTRAADVYRDAWGAAGDTVEAMNAMCNWIIAQPEVSRAWLMSEEVVRIEYKNGLSSSIALYRTGGSGGRLTRGGGPGRGGAGFKHTYTVGGHGKGTSSSMNIPKNKVLVFSPYYYEFSYPTPYPLLQTFDQAPQPLEVTVVTEKAANLAELRKVSDYGLIILNTHGLPGGFMIYAGADELDGLKDTKDNAPAFKDAENLPQEEVAAGTLELVTGVVVPPASAAAQTKVFQSALVTYKYISRLPKLEEAVVFGNHCYSGWTIGGSFINNLPQAWLERGAVSYYGYQFQDGMSTVVLNDFCKVVEDSLVSNLVRGDSTGVAHLAGDVAEQFYLKGRRRETLYPYPVTTDIARDILRRQNTEEELFFRHFLDPRYSYSCGCETFTDPRDGEKYTVVCIGNQKWLGQNLRWAGAGVCYQGSAANCKTFGRLYSIQETTNLAASSGNPSGVRGVCPPGWHVPSEAEVLQLANAAGGPSNAARLLKSKAHWPMPHQNTDTFCFAMLPAGRLVGNQFSDMGSSGEFWVTRVDEGDTVDGVLHYYSASFTEDDDEVSVNEYLINSAQDIAKLPCRCVKD